MKRSAKVDSDLWGLECAIEHGIQDGYFKENLAWAKSMKTRLGEVRKALSKFEKRGKRCSWGIRVISTSQGEKVKQSKVKQSKVK